MDLKEFKRDLYEFLKYHDVEISGGRDGEVYFQSTQNGWWLDEVIYDLNHEHSFFNDIREEV